MVEIHDWPSAPSLCSQSFKYIKLTPYMRNPHRGAGSASAAVGATFPARLRQARWDTPDAAFQDLARPGCRAR
ncbi:MAG: hypothetical protein LUC85_11265 [Bacteroidales bacterium]|nr:hypothetical protein [Bacteroidales bacterium]MCD8395382.1 hypothetical protein [Bacteroidales bacterium]